MTASKANPTDGGNTDNVPVYDGVVAEHVEPRYEGTANDREEMQAFGRVQELRRNFKLAAVLGFGCTLIGTWNFFLAFIAFGLTDGGVAGLIYGYIICLAGFACVYLSIAEMASMSPTAGGQYQWVSEFAPESCQKYLSYLSGWLVATGWQGGVMATAFLVGTIIDGLITLNYESHAPQPYQGTCLTIAVMVFVVVFNVFLAKQLPLVEVLLFVVYSVGFFAIIIPLWILAPKADAREVFTTFNNAGNWSSTGVAVMVGIAGVVPSLLGYDCVVHMAEEISDASRTLPLGIVYGVLVNGLAGLVMVLTLCFTLGDTNSILNSATGYPFIQVFFNATQSYAGTNTMVAIVIIAFVAADISGLATSSRQLWAFARDRGLPGSGWVAKVNTRFNIPLNAVIVSVFIVVLLSMLNLGSSVALNAFNSVTISASMSSYMLTIGCLVYRRLSGRSLPTRRWSLGRYGLGVNIVALCFLAPLFVFAFFPLATPVDEGTMDYGIVMFGGVIVISTTYYLIYGRKVYIAPVSLKRKDQYEM